MLSFVASLADLVRAGRGAGAPGGENHLRPRIVALLAEDDDRSVASSICRANRWEILLVNTAEEAHLALGLIKPQIVFFDRDLAPAEWRGAMRELAACANGACIMLISRFQDDGLWSEVVSHGGYEVVSKPLREDEISRAVRLAWTYWKSAAGAQVTVRK